MERSPVDCTKGFSRVNFKIRKFLKTEWTKKSTTLKYFTTLNRLSPFPV